VLYSPASVDRSHLTAGLAAYTSDLHKAQHDPRVGAKPAVVKAMALAQGSSSDVVISNEDASKVKNAQLTQGNVVFVLQ